MVCYCIQGTDFQKTVPCIQVFLLDKYLFLYGRKCTLQLKVWTWSQMPGFKSQTHDLPVVCAQASYLTSLPAHQHSWHTHSRHLEILVDLNWFLPNSLSLSVGNSANTLLDHSDSRYLSQMINTSEIFLFLRTVLANMNLVCSTTSQDPFLTMLGRSPFSYLPSDLRQLAGGWGVMQSYTREQKLRVQARTIFK